MTKKEDSGKRFGQVSSGPSRSKSTSVGKLFDELCRLSSFLRTEEGCPWDRAQTLGTLTPYLLEEACEAIEAVEHGDTDKLREELGDLIFLVIFMADIAGSEGKFTTDQVLGGIRTKMYRRHPHIFGSQRDMTPDQVKSQWEVIKKDEGGGRSILKDYPASMPGLIQAYRVQEKAAAVGFDWERTEQVADKVEEELREVRGALQQRQAQERPARKDSGQDQPGRKAPPLSKEKAAFKEIDPTRRNESPGDVGQQEELSQVVREPEGTPADSKGSASQELGDLLFAVVNLCRFTGTDPERAIRGSVEKFRRRFRYIEEQLEKRGSHPAASTLEEMDELWNEAKRKGI